MGERIALVRHPDCYGDSLGDVRLYIQSSTASEQLLRARTRTHANAEADRQARLQQRLHTRRGGPVAIKEILHMQAHGFGLNSTTRVGNKSCRCTRLYKRALQNQKTLLD